MSTTQLKNIALVGKLSITNWEAKKKAKSIEAKAEQDNGAKHGSITARKALLPGAKALEDIIKHSAGMRTWWNQVSAPWFDNGMRVYNVAGHMNIMAAYGDMARHRDGLVAQFLSEYPELREKARFDLNDLFDEQEYPMPGDVARRFTCTFEVMPLPDTGDFRVIEGLTDEIAAQLQAAAEAKVHERVAEAMNTTVRRVVEAVKHMADRLGDYTRKEDNDEKRAFYESWVGNVQDLAALIPQLNLTYDPAIAQIAQEIATSFDKPALFYKDNYEARQSAATKAADIASRLSSLFN